MRLVVWNANMAVHLKLPKLIDDLRPDVVVLSECANDEVLSGKFPKPPPWTSMEWVGSNPNKGLAVFTFGRYQVSSKTTIEPVLEWVAVVDIAGPVNFTLIAVWAMNQRASNIGDFPLSNPQPAAALDGYWSYQSGPTIIAGDFNHNVLWDRPGTPDKNHTKTLESARRAGLTSAYHYKTEEKQGEESTPTLYWRGRSSRKRTFHIDYAFIPNSWLPRIDDVTVGSAEEWVFSGLSDHAPLIVDIVDEI